MKRRIYLIRRAVKHWWQRRIRGWDDTDTWNLDIATAKFLAPRLKLFRELNNGYPGREPFDTPEKWDAALERMQKAMEYWAAEGPWEEPNETAKHEEGIRLFGEWFGALWW